MMARAVWWLALAAGLGAVGSVRGEELRLDFRTGSPDRGAVEAVGTDHGCAVEPSPAGLRVAIPARSGQGGAVGIQLLRRLRGDFEVTAEYAGLRAGPPAGGYGAGVVLVAELDAPDAAGLTVERQALPNEGEMFTSTHAFTPASGERQYRPQRVGASGRSGRLRLSRAGSRVTASYDDGTGEFQTLRAVELGPHDVALVRFACTTGHSDCPVDAVLVGLNVRADQLLPPGVSRAVARRSAPRVGRLALVLGVNLAVLVLLGVWWKRVSVWRLAPAVATAVEAAPAAARRRNGAGVALTAAAAVGVFGLGLVLHARAARLNEVHVDERDWLARAYFYRLAVLDGDLSHPLWGDADSIDAPHVSDFLIGASLQAAGQEVPAVPAASTHWWNDPMPSGPRLAAGRRPSVVLGAATAALVVVLGALATGRLWAGVVSGLLYAAHPLVLLCGGRAMTDAPYQFFSVLAMVAAAWVLGRVGAGGWWEPFGRRGVALLVVGPMAVGLATGAKPTGVFAGAAAAGTVLAAAAWRFARGGTDGRVSRAVDGAAFVALFAALTASWTVLANPTLLADPVGRFLRMVEHRREVGRGQAANWPQWAVRSYPERLQVVYDKTTREGLGPLGLPLAALAAGGTCLLAAGEVARWRRREPPTAALALLVWGAVLFAGLLPSLPLNWERYYLPFVPLWALAVGAAAAEAGARVCLALARAKARRGSAKAEAPAAAAA